MLRATQILLKGRKDLDLLKVLQSEIKHELSSQPIQDNRRGSLGDFVVDWDSPDTLDVVLRRKCESGEQVAISALFRPQAFWEGEVTKMTVLLKVFVKKPGLDSVLRFDCGVYGTSDRSQLNIHHAYYLRPTTCPGPSAYLGPKFGEPELHDLHEVLKQYLEAKGINESLANFLIQHMSKKEQSQYVNWLQKLESMVAKDD
ncbi:uncharacterized protein At2g39795, mitochondrial isoform X1 [Manihot esculenta]|uniref:Mitochondrial acidic protein MAM33 n=1 Tax=Manihot esculenta TaxID=3983 RepID=A0A2C9V792_MANES|nr:uncharacterized protein At2g39795, mitochondrial isoform X1 [Manihot esculenta]OAY40389.1 hypothetical protein MANES_09G018400v8 [Manihot esculenta]